MKRVYSFLSLLFVVCFFSSTAFAKDKNMEVKYLPDTHKDSMTTSKKATAHAASFANAGSCFVYTKSGPDYIQVKLPNNHPSCSKR